MAKRMHFTVSDNTTAVCGATDVWTTPSPRRVDCRRCAKRPQFIAAQAEDEAARLEMFLAQEPQGVKEPWRDGHIACSECGGVFFREADRTCYGHYANYVCADCGHTESRLTETGMSA